MQLRSLIAGLALAALLLLPSQGAPLWLHGPAPAMASFTISGQVDDATGKVLGGATAGTGAYTTTTGSSGSYTLQGLPAGTDTLAPPAPGRIFSPATRAVSVTAGLARQDVQASRDPLVFIPGIMGSRLFKQATGGSEAEVWANPLRILNPDDDLPELWLNATGTGPACSGGSCPTIALKSGTAGILTSVDLLGVGVPIYDPLINHLEDTDDYVESTNFWAYPYDWRKDLTSQVAGLDTLIQSILNKTGAKQVDIVAHSMGGLLARAYISEAAQAARVHRLIALGTPFLGTPKAAGILLGMACPIDHLSSFPDCLPYAGVTADMVPNFPAFYQLMPSTTYFSVKGGGFYGSGLTEDAISGQCTGCLSYSATYTASVMPDFNSAIWPDAQAFHTAALDSLDPAAVNGVPIDLIAGEDQQTMVGVEGTWRAWPEITPGETEIVPVFRPAGDGTVTLLSATLSNDGTTFGGPNPAGTGVNRRGQATLSCYDDSHMGLVSDSQVLDYVDELLADAGEAPRASPRAVQGAAGVSGDEIVAYGATAMNIYDGSGDHTGPSTTLSTDEEGIPGSAYFAATDVAVAALLGGQSYTLAITPRGTEPVDLEVVRSTATQTLTSTLFLGISATAQSRIRLAGDPFSSDAWQLDSSGDGAHLQTIPPTLVNPTGVPTDTVPPTLTVTLSRAPGTSTGPVTVTIQARDNITGTGVSRVEYILDDQPQVYVYGGPFEVDTQTVHVISARAIDRAGNVEHPPREVRIEPNAEQYLPFVAQGR
jgi:pimeloyl-ACP methyl ester carboxylesterase